MQKQILFIFFVVFFVACRNTDDQNIEVVPTETAVLQPTLEPTTPSPISQPTQTAPLTTQGNYLGQEPPGNTPQIFAPDIVSRSNYFEHSSAYFTPDLNQIFWIADYLSNPDNRELFFVTYENGEWTSPQTASFSEHYAAANLTFSSDGNRLYFSSARPLTTEGEAKEESDIWFVDQVDNNWSLPVHLGTGINSDNEEQLGVVLENGTIYYHDFYNIYRSEMIDGEYQQPEKLNQPINTGEMDLEPYVPDDESYILFSSTRAGGYGGGDIYISFKETDDSWAEPINLGRTINSRGNDRMPIISPDGKYLFFFRITNESHVYWVDAQIIEELRPEELSATTSADNTEPTTAPLEINEEEEIILENAQDLPFQTTYDIGLGDLDGDGDLDAVFANMKFDSSKVWLNGGSGKFVQTPQELTEQGHGVELGDFDGDGDLDAVIICATFNNNPKPTKIYFNDGSGTFTDSMQELGDLELGGNDVHTIDIENDGDIDIHVHYSPNINILYLNDGNGEFSTSIDLADGNIEWGDLNADGLVDIFLKEFVGEQLYHTFLNDGAGGFVEQWQMQDTNIIRAGEMLLGDFDVDGDLDAFIANGDRGAQYPSLLLFNHGDGTFEDSGQSLDVTHFAHLVQGDLTGDGVLDIFVANTWGVDQILINNGHGFFTDSGLVLDENAHSTIPSLGDLDLDGDLDIMVGSYESKPDYWFNETNHTLTTSYLGQTPPENMPEIFAPGFVSTENGSDYSSTFSPDGTEFYFTRVGPTGEHFIFVTKLEDGQWTTPTMAPFNSDPGFGGSEALITPDGEKLFFMSRRPLPGKTEPYQRPNMWMAERVANGWAAPEFFESDMMYVTQAANETLYFTDISQNTRYFIASQTLADGEYVDPHEVVIPALGRGSYGHPFIAPDESYLIFNSIPNNDNMDLFVVFKMEDGTWSEPQNFGETINTNGVEFAGMVTPDGQYFFFTRSNANSNEPADIYWVSAEIIETLRP